MSGGCSGGSRSALLFGGSGTPRLKSAAAQQPVAFFHPSMGLPLFGVDVMLTNRSFPPASSSAALSGLVHLVGRLAAKLP